MRDKCAEKRIPLKQIQDDYYLKRLLEFGPMNAGSVGWSDYLQVLLFEKFIKLFVEHPRDNDCTLLDVGCGVGDFSHFISSHGIKNIKYTGIDILPEMIAAAKKKYPLNNFKVEDFYTEKNTKIYDYIVCSGALNILTARNIDRHEKFVMDFIRKMFTQSLIGCAINLLAVDGKHYFPADEIFYYADRNFIFDFCSTLTKYVSVDYQEHEYVFTMLLHKNK